MRAVLSAGRQIQEIQRRRSASDLLAQELGRESPVPSKIMDYRCAHPRWFLRLQMEPLRRKFKPFLWARRGSGYRQSGPGVRFLQRSGIISARSQSGAVFLFRCRQVTTNRGRPQMSIDTLLLILLVAFGAGFVLNRLEFGRRTHRFG
jgi:hypothetical protein